VTPSQPSTLDALTRARYISLTTYRKDGTPVATPVWHVVDDGLLYVWTEAGSWKVKRLRRNPRVSVVACDIRGRVAPGAPVAEGTARLLDAAGTEKVRRLLGRKYVLARVGDWTATLTGRRRRHPVVALEISL
jgi:PPOX class probable F420-dependent enzyme